MTNAFHTQRTKRHPIGDDGVYGYEVIQRSSYDPLGYAARLYAIGTDGKVWTRTTNDPDRFFETGAVWDAAANSADMVAQKSHFVGVYESSKVRKH